MKRLLLIVILAAATVGCGTGNVRPGTPTVDCRQPAPVATDPMPAAEQWVEWIPPSTAWPQGVARLSQRAVDWMVGVLADRELDRRLWANQEACLDAYEKAGTIRR